MSKPNSERWFTWQEAEQEKRDLRNIRRQAGPETLGETIGALVFWALILALFGFWAYVLVWSVSQ